MGAALLSRPNPFMSRPFPFMCLFAIVVVIFPLLVENVICETHTRAVEILHLWHFLVVANEIKNRVEIKLQQ